MPNGSRIVLRVAAEADIPTPATDQVALFADSDDSDAPAWKDDGGTVHGLTGATGATGEGVATGGSTGQVLAKASGTDFDTAWEDRLSDQDAITYLDGTVAAAPATPAAGKLRIYAKTGDVLAVKDDAGNETVLGQGIADQGAFTFLDATEAAAPSTPASGTVRLYAKSDGRIYSKDDAGTEFGPFDAAGGGGALVGERKAWDDAGTYPLDADGSEFEYADLTAFQAFWSQHGVANADIFNPPGSHTEFRFDAQGEAIYRAMTFPTNGWLVAELTLTGWSSSAAGDQDNMLGIAILDTSGNGMGYAPYQGTFYNINVSGWAYASFGNSAAPTDYAGYLSGGHVWLGLERISSTQYRGAHSTTGTAWDTRPTANTPTAFTPAYIALIRMFSAGSQHVWRRVHRINIYSTAFP